jgi:pseudo-response regulator 7
VSCGSKTHMSDDLLMTYSSQIPQIGECPCVATEEDLYVPMLPSAIKANGYTSALHPVQQWMVPANATAGKTKADENTARNHFVHFENGGSGALQCGSSNVFDPPLEGQATNNYGGVKAGSNSGSNKGQNNGSMAAANAGLTETEIQAMDKSGVGGGNGNGSGSGSGNDTYVRRLAANMTPRQAQLKKYREKKKDRNFGKKVACFQLHLNFSSLFVFNYIYV